MITHIVFFRLRDKADTPELVRRLLAMRGRIPGLEHIEAGADFDRSSRAWDAALITRFADRASLDAYRSHPVHVEALTWIRAHVLESAVVDYHD